MNRTNLVFSAIVLIALSAATALTANTAAPKSKIIDIDTGKSGTYISRKWKYVFTITNEGSKSQGRLGELYYNGKRVIPARFLDLRKTPWGNIVWVGNPPLLWKPKGWMLRKTSLAKRQNKKLVPIPINYTKSGTYISGKWKYVFTITAPGDKSEERMGRLYYDGKEFLPISIKMLCHKTPWGDIVLGGAGSLMAGKDEGWLTRKEMESIEMPPPIETLFSNKNSLSKLKKTKIKRNKSVSNNPFFSALLPDKRKGKVSKWAVLPESLKLSQKSQRAIIMHNSQEEVLILTRELKAKKETNILEFIPFPSEPTIKLATGNPFKEINKLIHKNDLMLLGDMSKSGRQLVPIGIKLSKKIGLHDVTVIKINELSVFTQWVRDFFRKKGIKVTIDLTSFNKNAEDCINRGIHYFVFDYVSLKKETQSIEPLIYRFRTKKIYYPLKTSNVAGDKGIVGLIFISSGSFRGDRINQSRHLYNNQSNLYTPYFKLSRSPETRFRFDLSNSKRVYPEQIEPIYPEAKKFFSKTKKLYIQAMSYYGVCNFKDDFAFDTAKLDPQAYAWAQEGGPNLWEIRHYLRPVPDKKINKRVSGEMQGNMAIKMNVSGLSDQKDLNAKSKATKE